MQARGVLPYRDASLPVSDRVSDLLGRMTLQEKIGQLRCVLAWDYYDILNRRKVEPSASFKQAVADSHIGMLWATYRADPWTRKTLGNGLNPRLAALCGNALQRYVVEHTRLGIPLFLAEEAPHGHMAIGTTVFPTGLGMAATFDRDVIRRAGSVIAREMRLQGAHISYGPVIDLCREPRWSRVEENMGEDPVLAGDIAAAEVEGLGGGDLSKPYATLPTLKHFIGYGTTEGGHNGAPTCLGQREIRQFFLPPFRTAIKAGALSVMTSYNSLDGVPSTMDDGYLKGVLRQEWGFKGFIVSDLYSVDGIAVNHRVACDLTEAAAMALNAGVDVDLGGRSYAHLEEALQRGLTTQAVIDTACARVLRMKFEMGLFEHPYVDPAKAVAGVRTPDNVGVAREVALKSVTLLKNNGVLPLARNLKVVLVGPNADNVYNMLGDYTAPQDAGNVKTVLDGLRRYLPDSQLSYVKGCAIRDTTANGIAAAVAAARQADVVVACVGGSSARDFKTSYQATGAATVGAAILSDMESGEGYDRATLGLLGLQDRLLRELKETGRPLVVVYIEGRPLLKNWPAEHADALLTAYYPGQEGGDAIADVLFGAYNPAGRLPISVPRAVGQLPVFYNKKAVAQSYVEMSGQPLYAFGYGLSYTTFRYSNLHITQRGPQQFDVSFDVTNTGSRDGDDVPQLYLRDEVASVAQPVMQLRAFDRRFIRAGVTEHFVFHIGPEQLSIVGRDMREMVEPGDFTVMVGPSSDHIALRERFAVK
ncbi:beta-glucosidase [Hallella multisaccharivorax DSM 17128]|nr:beta-glucosidase [Hallella multisaccharivorax DSM 17128]